MWNQIRSSFCIILGLVCVLQSHYEKRIMIIPSSQNGQRLLSNFPVDTLPASFGFGRTATTAEIEKLDIDVRPDGKGLPSGVGLPATGKSIYESKCVACHGIGGIGGPNGSLAINPDPKLARREKVIGNYWPYATTIFDYVRRAMPFNQPGSLTDAEVYHLTAYLLYLNKIIDEKTEVTAQSLPKIQMPAQKYYVNDDRQGGPSIK